MKNSEQEGQSSRLGTVLSFPGRNSNSEEPTAVRQTPTPLGASPPSIDRTPTGASDQYREVFHRVSSTVREGDRVVSTEKQMAPISFTRLIVLPQEQRLATVASDGECQSFLLAEMFLERSRQSWHDDAVVAIESAEVALEIAKNLDEKSYGTYLRMGLEVRSRAFLGQALRVAGRLSDADREFAQLLPLLSEVTLEPYERAEILGLWSAALTERGEFEKAEETLSEVHDIYVQEGDDQKVGRTLIYLGMTCSERGDHERAIELLERSLKILDEDRSYKLVTVALVNLAVGLHGVGEYERAQAVIHETRVRLDSTRDRIFRARLRWIEARVFGSLGRVEEAESAFLEVMRFFSGREVDIDAALVCLDLAVLYIEQNHTDRVKALAQRMLPVFSSQGFGREVMAALILFQHAAEREIATLGLVQEISKYVERAFRVPDSSGEI